jgi:DNA invertase Pin-like site-specific DNA recombinase
MNSAKIAPQHLSRRAVIYVRQSTLDQVVHNLESQRRQYGLVERAVELGWPRSEVSVIDDDLGVSGSGVARSGFDRLVTDVGLGRVGIVFALEGSRLARNNKDWYHLLDLCAMVDTLIADVDGVYHPGTFNDRLLLGLKGTMSEVELHLIRSRLSGGLWEAARRGELRTHLPVGYEYDREGHIVFSPDEAVRETIGLVFNKFAELGSARQVVAYLAEQAVPLPHQDLSTGRVTWRSATYAAVHHMLTSPVYAGTYAYGRSKIERHFDQSGRLCTRQVPQSLDRWGVLIADHHPGFISFDAYRANLERLRSNWRAPKGEAGGAVREGAGLLQGLLRCGRCGRKMQVAYSGSRGNKFRRYACHQAVRLHAVEQPCQSLGGVRLEQRVLETFLEALAPASLAATLAALAEAKQIWQTELAQRELLVERARYEAERAQRQFERVEPENRLVARTLERTWEERLAELSCRNDEVARFRSSRPTPLSEDEIAWLKTAGADLVAVWQAPTTTARDRKQLLRCLIKQVVVTVDRARGVADLTVIWVGGAATQLTSRLNKVGEHRRVTPEQVVDFVRRLAPHHSNEQIAFILNAKQLRTGTGNTFTARRVQHLRQRLGIPTPIRRGSVDLDDPSWMDVNAAAAALGVSGDTIRRWAREGFLEARQVMPQAPWLVHVTDDVRARVVPDAPAGWLRLADVASELGRSKQTVLHWVQSGQLKAVQVVSGKRKGLRIELPDRGNGLLAEA